MGKDEVDVVKFAFVVLHSFVTFRLCPVALERCDNLYFRILQGISKAFMSLFSRRGTLQAENLHHLPLAVKSQVDVFAHHLPHFVVVGTDKGRVFRRIGLTFKHDDRDALVVGAVDSRRHGCQLVRGYDEQLNATFYETVNLLYLTLGVVTGCGEA